MTLFYADRHEMSKAVNSNNLQMRNRLQLLARLLIGKFHALMAKPVKSKTDISKLIGEIEGYINCRDSLAPLIAQDGYMAELSGLKGRLERMMDAIDV